MTEVEMIMDKNFCVKSAYWWPLKVRSSPNLLAWAKKPIWRVRPRKNTPSSWSHRPTCQRNQQRKKWTSARVALPVLTLTRSRWRSVCHTLVPFTVKFSTSKKTAGCHHHRLALGTPYVLNHPFWSEMSNVHIYWAIGWSSESPVR